MCVDTARLMISDCQWIQKKKNTVQSFSGTSKVDVFRAASDAGKRGFKLYCTLTGEAVDAAQCYKKKKHVVFLLVRAAEIEERRERERD